MSLFAGLARSGCRFSFISKRFAGHSKWANIKHTKQTKDLQKSVLISKMVQRIKVVIQDGGGTNPETNYLLAQAIEVARKNNVPNTTIQNAIKTSETDKSKMSSQTFDIRGPRGCLILVTVYCENLKRTKDSIASILKRFPAVFSDQPSKHLFEHKGIIVAKPPENLAEDAVVDHAIECGAEEVAPDEHEENHYEFQCEAKEMHTVKGNLEKKNYTIKSSDFNLVPVQFVQISEQEMESMNKLIQKLEDHPDVVRIDDNIA